MLFESVRYVVYVLTLCHCVPLPHAGVSNRASRLRAPPRIGSRIHQMIPCRQMPGGSATIFVLPRALVLLQRRHVCSRMEHTMRLPSWRTCTSASVQIIGCINRNTMAVAQQATAIWAEQIKAARPRWAGFSGACLQLAAGAAQLSDDRHFVCDPHVSTAFTQATGDCACMPDTTCP